MKNPKLGSFVHALAKVELDKSLQDVGLPCDLEEVTNNILAAMASHLNKPEPETEPAYLLPFSLLTVPQLLTIQKFLSEFSFHIDFFTVSKNICWYRIWPNWKK